MRWHAELVRCTRAMVLRGYKHGSYAASSPYAALMLVTTRRGRHAVRGLLATDALSKQDIARLRRVCAKHGVRLVHTRRHGRSTSLRA